MNIFRAARSAKTSRDGDGQRKRREHGREHGHARGLRERRRAVAVIRVVRARFCPARERGVQIGRDQRDKHAAHAPLHDDEEHLHAEPPARPQRDRGDAGERARARVARARERLLAAHQQPCATRRRPRRESESWRN